MLDTGDTTFTGGRAQRPITFPDVPLIVWVSLFVAAIGPSAAGSARPEPAPRSDGLSRRIVFAQVPVRGVETVGGVGSPLNDDEPLPLGSRIVVFDPQDPTGGVLNLTPGFAAAGRPDLSFDARRILFIGKQRPADSPGVWEMRIDGSAARRIAEGPGDCREAIYLSTIYTLDAEEPVRQIAFRSSLRAGRPGSLYTCRMDGSRIRRITFTPHGVSDPLLLSDGRLLVSVWSPGGPVPPDGPDLRAGPSPRVSSRTSALFTIYPDGTDLFPFAGVHERPAARGMPCEIPDGRVVYVESGVGGTDRGGSLVAVSRTRSLRTRHVLTQETDGLYRSPSPLPDGRLLVSCRPARGGSYGLYVFDLKTGARIKKLFDAVEWHDVDAALIHPRSEPAGRSSVVNDKVDSGQLYCLNAYLSAATAGPAVELGRIRRLRIIRAPVNANDRPTQDTDQIENVTNPANDSMGGSRDRPSGSPRAPLTDDRTTRRERRTGAAMEVVLGEIPVEADGSFFVEVPARVPLRLETLDADGTVLRSMRSWLWVMPNERRGCIGCHEDRELTPPNRHVLALRKAPRKMSAVRRPAETIETPARARSVQSP